MLQVDRRITLQSGRRSDILVAAPHHGCIEGCDYYTKEFAVLLAGHLGAALIVAENMRPLADLNKDPQLAPTAEARDLCLAYQRQALADQVQLLIEIHGHVHGKYAVQISCGFAPDPLLAADSELICRLGLLQAVLNRELDREWPDGFLLPRPSVGIYPLQEDVVMKATKTYLFQQIREQRLAGRGVTGVHIEIFKDYKCDGVDSPTYLCQQALVRAVAVGMRKAFLDTPL